MKRIEVVQISDQTIVHTVDVTGKSDHLIEKCEHGILRNMDRDHFFTRVVDDNKGA